MVKPKLNIVLVVEGKSDTSRLQQLFDVQTIETNGSALTNQTINLIQKTLKKQEVILLLDCDYQGRQIASRIQEQIPNIKTCYCVTKSKNKKQGIAELDNVTLINKLSPFINYQTTTHNNSLTWLQYLSLNLMTKSKRLKLTNKLNIPYFNHQKLYKVLCLLQYNYEQIKNKLEHQ